MTIALGSRRKAQVDPTASMRSTTLTSTARQCREWGVRDDRTVLRWPVGEDLGGVGRRLGCGVGAVEFSASRGRAVLAVLRDWGSLGPVLTLPGQPARWVFLSSPDDSGAAVSGVAMIGARLRMTGPEALALPPSVTTFGPACWIVSPEPGATTVLGLHAVLSAAWRTAE